jgi:hypothetical protein
VAHGGACIARNRAYRLPKRVVAIFESITTAGLRQDLLCRRCVGHVYRNVHFRLYVALLPAARLVGRRLIGRRLIGRRLVGRRLVGGRLSSIPY